MYKAKINEIKSVELEIDSEKKVRINQKEIAFEFFREHKNIIRILKDNKTFDVLVLKFDSKKKAATLKVNGNRYNVSLLDKNDELLTKLGFDNNSQKQTNNVKAPMPGLVLNVLVEVGKEVLKGDALIILEAMKMENILKSPTNGIIKNISVKNGNAVEKNQILIEF